MSEDKVIISLFLYCACACTCVLIGTVCYFPAGSRTAGRKVQQKSVGAEVEKTTETEREGAQLNGRGQGDYIAVFNLDICVCAVF